MKAAAFGLALVVGLAAVPAAEAQTLEEQFQDFHFKYFRLVFSWDESRNLAYVYAVGEGLEIRGEGARDLRECMDGGDCPIPELRSAASASNEDGELSRDEVDSFAFNLAVGLRVYQDMKVIQQNVKGLVKVDDKVPGSAILTDVRIHGAVGDVASVEPLSIDAVITATFGTVKAASTHKVWVQRTESNLTVADEIIVEGGKNWRIVESSIQPASVQSFYSDGRLQGSQGAFESRDPLTFTLEYHKETSTATIVGGSLLALAAVGAGAGVYLWRRKG
ncbi:MAG: hypothetical protein HYT80_10995 [Euryarchaeota archaeon]|nr:hypothetical protein [Euryarchaeota archaeon]